MTQQHIMDILISMGGKAHHSQIIERARLEFPDYKDKDLRNYVSRKLNIMKRWGEVTKDYHGTWYVKDPSTLR